MSRRRAIKSTGAVTLGVTGVVTAGVTLCVTVSVTGFWPSRVMAFVTGLAASRFFRDSPLSFFLARYFADRSASVIGIGRCSGTTFSLRSLAACDIGSAPVLQVRRDALMAPVRRVAANHALDGASRQIKFPQFDFAQYFARSNHQVLHRR